MSQFWDALRQAGPQSERPMDGRNAAFFMRRLQLLFTSSVPILAALETLERQEEDPYWSEALGLAVARLERGQSLSVALSSAPSPVITAQSAQILKLGETSGRLDVVLRELANSLEASAELAKRFKSALTLPAFQAVFSFLLLGVMVSTLIPPMLNLSQVIGADLGPLVKGCLALVVILLDPWTLFGLAQLSVAVAFLVRRWLATESGRLTFDKALLRLPVVGPLLVDQAIFTFAQGLRALLNCGSGMVPALRGTADTITNTALRAELDEVVARIVDGSSLHQALRLETSFDPIFISVVAVGEETGSLPLLLGRMSGFFQKRVEDRLDLLVSLLEPLILGLLGGVVTLLSLLFFVPIVKVIQAL